MNLCKKFYKDALLAKEWMEPDDNQQKILALQSEINQVERKQHSKEKKQRRPRWKYQEKGGKRMGVKENSSKTR
jgi:hypothetical protein